MCLLPRVPEFSLIAYCGIRLWYGSLHRIARRVLSSALKMQSFCNCHRRLRMEGCQFDMHSSRVEMDVVMF
jgi:hypothetical protein